MIRLNIGTTILWLLVACASAGPASAYPALNESQRLAIQRGVVPAAVIGDHAALLRVLVPLSNQLTNEQIVEADEILVEAKLPPFAELLVTARVELLSSAGGRVRVPAPSSRETLLLLPAIHRRIKGDLALADERLRSMRTRLPDDFVDYGRRQQESAMLQRRIETTSGLAEFAAGVAKKQRRLARKDLTDAQQQALAFDYSDAQRTLQERIEQVIAEEARQRLARLRDAESVLRLSGDLDERFRAAVAIADDVFRFPADEPVSRRTTASQATDAEDLGSQVQELRKRGQEAAGERLQMLAEHFVTGMSWWTRGRFGQGTMANGLLKPEHAKRSQAVLVNLKMPVELPDESTQSTSDSNVTPDRRHHYAWNWENRHIYVSGGGGTSEKIISSNVTNTTLWTRRFSPEFL